MKLLRIDSEKILDREIDTIHIELDGCIYRIIESYGKLSINKTSIIDEHSDEIAVYPKVSNVIDIK